MTLLMRDQENVEKGLEKGLEQGLSKGIIGAISMCRDLHLPEDVILKKLIEKFHLTEREARDYLRNAKSD